MPAEKFGDHVAERKRILVKERRARVSLRCSKADALAKRKRVLDLGSRNRPVNLGIRRKVIEGKASEIEPRLVHQGRGYRRDPGQETGRVEAVVCVIRHRTALCARIGVRVVVKGQKRACGKNVAALVVVNASVVLIPGGGGGQKDLRVLEFWYRCKARSVGGPGGGRCIDIRAVCGDRGANIHAS